MTLLRHELILKYFRSNGCWQHLNCKDEKVCEYMEMEMALRILTAMEEPIKKGERYLGVMIGDSIGEFEFHKNDPMIVTDDVLDGFHAYQIRLPQRFQPRPAEGKVCYHESSFRCELCHEWVTNGTICKPTATPAKIDTPQQVYERDVLERCKPPTQADEVEQRIEDISQGDKTLKTMLKELVQLARKGER